MSDKENQKQAASLPAEALAKEGVKGSGEPKEDLHKKVAATESGEPRPDDSGREDLEKQKAEYLAGWQRERADFLNYKKEEMERIGQLIGYAKEELILEILPLMDNFELATRLRPDDGTSARQGKNDKIFEGFVQIKNQFQDFLKSLGVEEIKAVGEIFDPKLHEIVEEAEPFDAAQGQKSGVIFEEVQKGYKSNGRLLRPAKVKIIK